MEKYILIYSLIIFFISTVYCRARINGLSNIEKYGIAIGKNIPPNDYIISALIKVISIGCIFIAFIMYLFKYL